MTLTPKQEKFAQLYVELGNASEAYRQAYESKAKPESVHVRASELLSDSKVSVRVQELRDDLAEKALWKRLRSVEVLSNVALGAEKDSDKVAAVKALNAMYGWDAPVKVDHTTKGEQLPAPVFNFVGVNADSD